MNKHLRLFFEAETTTYPTQRVIGLRLHDESISEWTLGLCLLEQGLIESLMVTSRLTAMKMEIGGLGSRNTSLRALSDLTGDVLRLRVSGTELQYWLKFFLKYVRDGFGEVDHLDVATDAIDRSDQLPTTIILKVQQFAAPVSRDEAIRRLRG